MLATKLGEPDYVVPRMIAASGPDVSGICAIENEPVLPRLVAVLDLPARDGQLTQADAADRPGDQDARPAEPGAQQQCSVPRLSPEEVAELPGGARWRERHADALAASPPVASVLHYPGGRAALARLAAEHRPFWALWRAFVAGCREAWVRRKVPARDERMPASGDEANVTGGRPPAQTAGASGSGPLPILAGTAPAKTDRCGQSACGP